MHLALSCVSNLYTSPCPAARVAVPLSGIRVQPGQMQHASAQTFRPRSEQPREPSARVAPQMPLVEGKSPDPLPPDLVTSTRVQARASVATSIAAYRPIWCDPN